jgi:Cu(I)/Ag(I) efflux system membrane fusion protein
MNNRVFIALFVFAALITGIAGYWLGAGKVETEIAMQEVKEVRAPLYYRNPMNPTITSPKPAKDEMGMDYIPVYSKDDVSSSVAGTVLIDPVTVQSMGIRTTKAARRSLVKTIYTWGRIDYDETSITRLHPKTEGWVELMQVETTGQSLKHDDILLSIYSPQLVSAQEEYLLALNRSTASSVTGQLAETALRRLELLDVPNHQIEELKQDREVKKYLHIHSPAAGTVIKVGVREGQYVTPKTELYFIADLAKVWVFVNIFEDELAWVKEGDHARMSVKGIPGKTFSGQLTYIYPYADRQTRTIKARLEFDNPGLLLKPDMYAEIEIAVGRRASAISVPSEAVVRSGTREKIFVQVSEGKFEPREVVLGVTSKGWIEVLKGVTSGESVVTSAQFLIDSESKLREAAAKMSVLAPRIDNENKETHLNHDGEQIDQGDHGKLEIDQAFNQSEHNRSGMKRHSSGIHEKHPRIDGDSKFRKDHNYD